MGKNLAIKNFSTNLPPKTNPMISLSMIIGAGCITGITYLSYVGHMMRAKATP